MSTFKMIGTTGTDFTGVSQTSAGKLGFRSLGAEGFRVRVEPASGKTLGLTRDGGWSQPEGTVRTNRYSKVVQGATGLALALVEGQKALDIASVKFVPAHTEVKLVEQTVSVPDSIVIE